MRTCAWSARAVLGGRQHGGEVAGIADLQEGTPWSGAVREGFLEVEHGIHPEGRDGVGRSRRGGEMGPLPLLRCGAPVC